jgi:hypothetical protein
MIPSAPRGSKHRVTTDEKMILGEPGHGREDGRFDKVACLRFDERTEKADLRLWEYNCDRERPSARVDHAGLLWLHTAAISECIALYF